MKERIEQILDENLDSNLIHTLIEGYEVNITGKERAAEEIEKLLPKFRLITEEKPEYYYPVIIASKNKDFALRAYLYLNAEGEWWNNTEFNNIPIQTYPYWMPESELLKLLPEGIK